MSKIKFEEPNLKTPYYSAPVYDGTYLYDVTSGGGTHNKGAIFKVKPNNTSISGNYEIIVSGGTDNNYDFSCQNGKLTINPLNSINAPDSPFSFYPNPAGELINIKFSGALLHVKVYNITGVKVIDKIVTNHKLNIKALPSGIYYIIVDNNSFKLIK